MAISLGALVRVCSPTHLLVGGSIQLERPLPEAGPSSRQRTTTRWPRSRGPASLTTANRCLPKRPVGIWRFGAGTGGNLLF